MLNAGGYTLRRAISSDLPAVVALQRAAYARNRALLGLEPLPLLADYERILADYEVWLAGEPDIAGVLILEPGAQDLLIWSVATHPSRQSTGLGNALLEAAEVRARALGLSRVRLYTGASLQHLLDWYARHGYAIDCVEHLPDRDITHMSKQL